MWVIYIVADIYNLIPRREKLQAELEEILGSDNVYFNPGSDVRLTYPCILYNWSSDNDLFADDVRYRQHYIYDVTLIDRDVDSPLARKLLDGKFKYISLSRIYKADNLNHFVFDLFY